MSDNTGRHVVALELEQVSTQALMPCVTKPEIDRTTFCDNALVFEK